MKIIIIANHNGFKSRPDKLDYLFLMYLSSHSKYEIILCENNDFDHYKDIQPNDIIIVFTCKPTINRCSNKKIYWIYDLSCDCYYNCDGTSKHCKFKNQYSYIENNHFDHVWTKYKTPITNKLLLKNNWHCFPHMMFDKEIHKHYVETKKYDILFYGNTNPKVYPFRNRLYYLLQSNTNKFNIMFLPYSKKHPNKMTTGKDLIKCISQSWLSISTCAVSNCLLAKYYEIGLGGSTILGNYPEHEDDQYIKNNMVYINRFMTDEEIIRIITNALKDKNRLTDYSIKTKKYISSHYMYKNGLEKFESLIDLV